MVHHVGRVFKHTCGMSQVRQELAVREREIRDKQVQNIKTALGALSVAEAPNDGANQLR